MSSKSRKSKPKPKPKAGPKPSAKASGSAAKATPVAARAPKSQDEDELIHAPKGKSRLRFALTVLLVIVLLVIFMVPGAIIGSFGQGGVGGETKMVWTDPARGRVELTVNEFLLEKARWDDFFRAIDRTGRSPRLTDEVVAGLIVLDSAAEAAGVTVSDGELVEVIFGFSGGDVEAYKRSIGARFAGGVRGFEEALRSFLRYDRYLSLLTYLGAPPSPERIEELWREQHQEYSFEYVRAAVDGYRAAAEAELDDAVLAAWFEGLSEPERNRYRTPERTSAEQVRLRLEGFDPTALLAAYPLAEDADLDAIAQAYYDQVYTTRFLNQPPEDASAEVLREFQYFTPFEDVADVAREEGPIHLALSDFASDVAAREAAGEEVDLAAEAAALGLDHDPGGVPRTWEEWRELEDWGGSYFASRLGRGDAGVVSTDVIPEKGALVVARLQEKLPPALPDFAEIRDRVAEDWVEDRAAELAVAALAELRASFAGDGEEAADLAPSVDAAVFRAAAEELGLAVETSDWKDKGDRGLFGADATGFERFLATHRDLFTLESGQVGEPATDAAQENVYLVRCAGVREVPLERMEPLDYQMLRASATFEAQEEFRLQVLGVGPSLTGSPVPEVSGALLRERYGLELFSPEAEG